jgi:hypothetical protein
MEDASDELLLVDGDENIPFFMGEVFIYHDMEQTQVQCRSFIIWIFLLHLCFMRLYGTSKPQDKGNLEYLLRCTEVPC